MIDILKYIAGFYQTYMKCWTIIRDQIIQIDKQIYDFLEIKFQNIDRLHSNNVEVNYMQLLLNKLKLQAQLLQNFDRLELSQKIQLYEEYQQLHQKILEFKGADSQMNKIQSLFNSQALFTHLAQIWNLDQVEPNSIREKEFAKYALDQLVKIFDEIQIVNVSDEQKIQWISAALNSICFIFDQSKLFYFLSQKKFLLNILVKIEKAFQQFKSIIPFEFYISQKQIFILKFIQLGYIDKALELTQEIYELRPQLNFTKFTILYDILFYYCLRKTENKNYDLDELLQKINPQGFNQEDLILYNQLIQIQELHKLIMQEKYEELQPIITKILSVPFKSNAQKYFLLPLLCDMIIYHPKIPNQLKNSKLLLSNILQLEFPNDSIYLITLRRLKIYMLFFIVQGDKVDKKFSESVPYLLIDSMCDEQLEKEIMCSIIKFIPQVSSDKTYKLLADIIDQCTSHLQQDQKKQNNIKFLEILNQQKRILIQKYTKIES